MGDFGEIASEVFKWISDNRRLRVFLISIVFFGCIAFFVDRYALAPQVGRGWFFGVYAAAIFSFSILITFIMDVAVVKWRDLRKEKHEANQNQERNLANFFALPENYKLCFVYLKQKGTRRFVDQDYAMLGDLVNLGVLEEHGGLQLATVFEVPSYIWQVMQKEGWGSEYPSLDRGPWHPESWRI